MGGKGKHDRRMGAWEARESMIDAWGCMGMHGDALGGMGRRWDQKM